MNPIELAKEFVLRRFPECHSAMVTGSAVTGRMKPKSDIDIVIVTSISNSPYIEKLIDQDQKFDTIVLPKNRLNEIIEMDLVRQSAANIDMLIKGTVIIDHNDFLTEFQSYVRDRFTQGKAPMNYQQLKMNVVHLSNLLEDFEDERDHYEEMFILQDITVVFCRLHILYHRRWPGRGKRMNHELQELDPDLYQRMCKALDSYYRSQDKQAVKDLVSDTLEMYGGRIDTYSSRINGSEIVKGDRLYIGLKEGYEKEFFTTQTLPAIITSQNIMDSIDTFYYYHDEIRGYRTLLSFKGDKEKLRTIVVPAVDRILFLQEQYFPNAVKFEPEYPDIPLLPMSYGGTKCLSLLEGFYTRTVRMLGKITLDQVGNWSQDVVISYSLFIYIAFLKEMLDTSDHRVALNQYLLDLWLSQSYDHENTLNYSQLLEARETKLAEFGEMYESFGSAFGIQEDFAKEYDEIEVEDEWLVSWIEDLRQLKQDLNRLEEEGELSVFQYLKEDLSDDLPEKLKTKMIIFVGALDKVINIMGIYIHNMALFPYMYLKFIGMETTPSNQSKA